MTTLRLDRRAFLGLGAGLLGVALTPSWLRGRESLVRSTVPVMGTIGELGIAGREGAGTRAILAAAGAELRRVESLMTRFTPDSDVGRFNSAAVGTRVPVSPETAQVVRRARDWAVWTDGAFDPTLERLTRIWDPGSTQTPPDAATRREAAADVGGWAALEIHSDGTDAWILRAPGTALDLGGIAKGWGIDRAADLLVALGVESALVNVGGDLVAIGEAPGGRPWTVGVRDPGDPSGTVRTLELRDGAMATSGDYLRAFDFDGVRYSHILDPSTGAPRRGSLRTVTVVSRDAVMADAAATAAFTLGPVAAGARFRALPVVVRIAHSG